jgi:hypothetical protein
MNLDKPITDVGNALECLMYCERAYGDDTYITDKAHFNIIQLPNCIVVAARGSWSEVDWINDCDFLFADTIYGSVHTGFWSSTSTILPRIHEAIRGMPALPIVVTGHSLGGDQGILTAMDLATIKLPVDRVITFGAARPGGGEFKRNYDAKLGQQTCCWVDASDIVPRLPFTELGYVSVGQMAFLRSDFGMVVNPNGWEMVHDEIVEAVADVRAGRVGFIADHSLSHYQDRIIKLTP